MPLWMTGELDSLEVIVTTGSSGVSGTCEIALLPFILDQDKEFVQSETIKVGELNLIK